MDYVFNDPHAWDKMPESAREDTLREHRPHLVREPVVELRAVCNVVDAFDAKADFRKGDGADEQQIERLGRDEADDLEVRF